MCVVRVSCSLRINFGTMPNQFILYILFFIWLLNEIFFDFYIRTKLFFLSNWNSQISPIICIYSAMNLKTIRKETPTLICIIFIGYLFLESKRSRNISSIQIKHMVYVECLWEIQLNKLNETYFFVLRFFHTITKLHNFHYFSIDSALC